MQYIQVVASNGEEALELVNRLTGWVYPGDFGTLERSLLRLYGDREIYLLLQPGTREISGLATNAFWGVFIESSTIYPARGLIDTYLSYNDC